MHIDFHEIWLVVYGKLIDFITRLYIYKKIVRLYIVRTYDLYCSLIRSVLGKVALFDDNRYWISGAFTLKVKQMIKRWLWLHSEKTVAFLWKGQCLVSICNSHMSAFFQNTFYRAVKCPLVEMEPLATYKSWHKSYVVIN